MFARKLLRPFGGLTKEDIANEARAISKLCGSVDSIHENIVQVLQHGWLSKSSSYYFIDMEFCEWSLDQYIDASSSKPLSLELNEAFWNRVICMLQIADDLTRGVGFIHTRGEVHRDLKPSNGIFLSTPGFVLKVVLFFHRAHRWKIADFGLSCETLSSRLYTTLHSQGTTSYRAPEILSEDPKYNFKSDIWALGCIIYGTVHWNEGFC